MNLTQTQLDAKQAFLVNRQAEMLAQYEKADRSERNAVIKHIDSFLEVIPADAKTFWLKFRQNLEMLNETTFDTKPPAVDLKSSF